MATFLVTGGAGFIGSHIVDELVRRGETVRVLDNLSTGKLENLSDSWESIEFVEGDIRDADALRDVMDGVDYVLHQAALPSVPRSVADPATSHEVNATGTLNVLVAARDAGIKRLVYASSSSVYGNSPELPKSEDMPTNPLSPYAVSKLAGENYCRAFYQVYGLETVALRYFNVFGPRQDPNSQYSAVIPKFVTMMLRGQVPTIHGDGTQSRDFTYVANVVQANLLAASATGAVGQFVNIACGQRHSLLDLVAAIGDTVGMVLQPHFTVSRVGDVQHSLASIDQAVQILHYAARIGFREGLRRTIHSFEVRVPAIESAPQP